MNFSNKFSHVRLFLRHHDDRVWLRKGRRHIIHLVKNLLADDRQADRRMRVMSRRVSWFQLMLTFHVSRWMTASPMWQQNNQLTSANQVIVFFCKSSRNSFCSSYHNNYFIFSSFDDSRIFLSLSLVALFVYYFFVYLSDDSLCLYIQFFIFFQIGFYFWIQNATCLNTIRDIEKLSTVLVSL